MTTTLAHANSAVRMRIRHAMYNRGPITVCPGASPIEKAFALAWRSLAGNFPTSQAQIGCARVDFLIEDLVVECDGHMFHSTKEQRAADVARDRYLLERGYRVVRFTGAELHKDALACAEQVKRILDSQAVRLRAQERLHQEMLDFYLGPAVEDWNSFQYYARRKET